jgi:hypothetical protein
MLVRRTGPVLRTCSFFTVSLLPLEQECIDGLMTGGVWLSENQGSLC